VRLTGTQNLLYFGLKCSKSHRFLGRCWGSLRRSTRP